MTAEAPAGSGAALPTGTVRWRKLGVRVLVSLTVLGVAFSLADRDTVVAGFRRLEVADWMLALLAFLVLHAVSALKWRFFLALVGARLPLANALHCHAAGLFANLCLPSLIGGDVLRAGLALRATDRRTALVVGSVVDRVADLAALLSVTLVGLVLAPWARERLGGTGSLVTLGAALALGAVCGVVALRLAYARARRLPRKLGRKVVEVMRAVTVLQANPVRAVCGYLLAVVLQSGFVLVNVGLGERVGLDLPVALWFLLWPLAKIAAMAPLSFGGLGVREAAFSTLVTPFGDGNLAFTQSLVWQTVLIAGGLACGAVWTFWTPAGRSAEATT